MIHQRLPRAVTVVAAAAAVGLAAAPATAAASGTFTPTGSMNAGHTHATATLLPDGQVLVAGDGGTPELYNPGAGSWTGTGQMNTPRTDSTATLLPDGQVLVAGGTSVTGTFALSSAELYHPATGQWSNASTGLGTCEAISECRSFSTATLLPAGNVLVAGGLVGLDQNPQTTATAMLYHPDTNTWTSTGPMTTAREGQTATLLPGGKVLMAGGTLYDHPSAGHPGVFMVLSSAELYTP